MDSHGAIATCEGSSAPVANTVNGKVPADELGVVLMCRGLLGLVPGAELAPENNVSKSDLFARLRGLLVTLHDHGVGAVVDLGGMTLGRDLRLYQLLSRQTGVHVIGSTGLGEEVFVGSHFTNPTSLYMIPPTPTDAGELAELFALEVEAGMAIPRQQRSSLAGVISIAASAGGMTAFEEVVFRAAARASIRTGAPVAVRCGNRPLAELDVLIDAGLDPRRIVLGNVDRIDLAGQHDMLLALVETGASVSFDHSGWTREQGYLDDADRIAAILRLAEAGHAERLVVGSGGFGYAVGFPEEPVSAVNPVQHFIPPLADSGADERLIGKLMTQNQHRLLGLATPGATWTVSTSSARPRVCARQDCC